MPKVKVPRKSTTIDMTAMCDVAFLLLSFFILTTKFKPSETLAVVTPSSVANKVAEQKDMAMVTIDKDGKVFLSFSDDAPKQEVIETVNSLRNLGLTDAEMKNFAKGPFVGVPFSQLKSYLQQPIDNWPKISSPGIPVTDTANNEMVDWMRAVATAFQGTKMNLLLKGDNASKYPTFKGVTDAFKKNDLMKFGMITNPSGVPVGTDLYRDNLNRAAGQKVEE
ncbi:ExbD/TolR family protein [Flavihumibacter petaseus]|uniref:Putative ExbD/TolR family membrane protein n=1 Tax=Flavihumibacter petaseus NBRC 106054 TaxID=1220578 RepID=A0A0E9MUQ2_9BACT|nr:biopolymer transporter ExbD [Flavihumibacter petaseus]GAO41472.1 putative ExbD/TolR family membrane protein [Flavihumibacter petaseus NBRC 106054]